MSPIANEDVLYADNFDTSALGVWVKTPSGWADGPLVDRPHAVLGGRAGEIVVTREASIGGRDLSIPFDFHNTSQSLYRSRLAALKRLFYGGAYMHLRFGGWPDREALVQIKQLTIDPDSYPGDELNARGVLQVHAPRPYMQARRLDVFTLVPGRELPLEVGDAPSDLEIRVHGPTASEINVQAFSAAGVAIGLLKLTGTALLAGEALNVRGEDGQILKYNASGIAVESYGYLSTLGDYITLDHGFRHAR
jgi:hypothetical protein